MKTPFSFFARRSIAPWMGVVYVLVLVAVTHTRDNWVYDASSAVNWTTGGLLLTLPIAAGASAFDAWRFHRGDWRNTLLPTMRPSRSLGALAGIHAVAIGGAWLLVCAGAVAIAWAHGASPQVSITMLAHPAILCLFVPTLGVTVGALVPRNWIAPATAVGFFAVSVIAESRGPYHRFLTALGFTAWSPYTQLDPRLVWLKCIALMLLTLAGAIAWRTLGKPAALRARPRRFATGIAAAGLLTVAFAGAIQSPEFNGLVQTPWDGALTCTGSSVKFCKNEPAALAQPFSTAVAAAYVDLAPYGITPPAKFVDALVLRSGDPDVGVWGVDPTYLVDGLPTPDATAGTVSMPAACAAYFDNTISADGDRLLTASSFVFDFVYALEFSKVSGDDPSTTWADSHPGVTWDAARDSIGTVYAAVAACDASALPNDFS